MIASSATIRFGSVCSGIEAASVAFTPIGWDAAWFAEIEPFPCSVLAHHYPTVPNLGDMTTIADRILSGEAEAPDILCGGTPCQAFSVAGKRESLQNARGTLSLSFVELADAIDDVRLGRSEPPCIVLWENVPGVLSTGDNAFGCFLAGLAGECEPLQPPGGRWSDAGGVLGPRRVVAWRILDAQYFGLAQRRRRVFVVASSLEDFDPVAVLLVEQGVRRDPASGGEAREGVARGSGDGLAKSLRARSNLAHREDADTLVFGGGNGGGIDVATTCSAKGGTGRMDFESETFVVGTCPTLRSGSPNQHPVKTDGLSDALDTTGPGAVAFNWMNAGNEGYAMGPIAGPLDCCQTKAVAEPSMAIRRLTPVECERLQGFPDNYTRIPGMKSWRDLDETETPEGQRALGFGVKQTKSGAWRVNDPDGPRYRALGNSWAVPCVRWIGRRIDAAMLAATRCYQEMRMQEIGRPSLGRQSAKAGEG